VARDADRVALLKGIRPDEVRGDLSGEHNDRDGIEQRVRDARDGIGRAGAGGDEHDAGLAGRACIALGRMDRGLLVADEDVLDHRLLEQRIIDRQHGAARIAENGIDAELGQRLDEIFRSGFLFVHSHGFLDSARACTRLKRSGQPHRL